MSESERERKSERESEREAHLQLFVADLLISVLVRFQLLSRWLQVEKNLSCQIKKRECSYCPLVYLSILSSLYKTNGRVSGA